ncbi:MAG: protoporphyrinogen/coproporphyrinogen oxidase [Chitinispirillaceae bacterium]
MKNVVIIGGGLAGLGAAWRLQQERDNGAPVTYTLFEKEPRAGGLCRTERDGDFFYDYTGHLLHFRTETFRELVFSLIGSKLEKRNRSAWIHSKDVYTRYPFQANLFGLPPEVVADCVYEYSKQYFRETKGEVKTFEDWIRAYFGDGIAAHFMIPYNRKLYKRHPRELTPDCTGRFVPSSNLKLLLMGALSDMGEGLGYNSHFFYPRHGGIETLVRSIAVKLDDLNLNESVVSIDSAGKVITTSRGERVPYDFLVSTQPIPELVQSIDEAELSLTEEVKKLKHVSVLNINLGVRGDLGDKHWVYVPEDEFIFHRLGFPHNFSDYMAPEDHGSIYVEISYDPQEGIDVEWARKKTVEDLIRMGIISSEDQIVSEKIMDIPYGYVIFNSDRRKALKKINGILDEMRIYSAGRFGSWEYSSMEDAFFLGAGAAEDIFIRHIRMAELNTRIRLDPNMEN